MPCADLPDTVPARPETCRRRPGRISSWSTAASEPVGSTAAGFPTDDYAIVRYAGGVAHPGTVGAQDVVSAGSPYVGEAVCMRGGVSGIRCGRVLGVNATVFYADGAVYGLIRTNICAVHGDDGAPLYDGGEVLGILSAISGDCASSGAWFQPITEPLGRYGVSVY